MAAERSPSVCLIMFFRAQFVAVFTPNVTKRPQRHFSFPSPPPSPPSPPWHPKSHSASTVPVQMITSKCPERPLLSGPLASSAHSEELVISQGLQSAIRTVTPGMAERRLGPPLPFPANILKSAASARVSWSPDGAMITLSCRKAHAALTCHVKVVVRSAPHTN